MAGPKHEWGVEKFVDFILLKSQREYSTGLASAISLKLALGTIKAVISGKL